MVKMMEAFLGEENLMRGLRAYLKAKQYQNAEQDDVWRHLEENVQDLKLPTSIKTIMDTWTKQAGYPMVTVRRNYDDKTAVAKQERFYETFKPPNEAITSYWWVPLTYMSKGEKRIDWMDRPELKFTHNIGTDEPLIVNHEQSGYYRVDYDQQNWDLIIQQLERDHTKIPVKNRAQLYDDSYSLLLSEDVDIMPLATWKRLHDTLRKDDNYVPWTAAMLNMHHFYQLVRHQPSLRPEAERVRKWVLGIMLPPFEKLGYSTREGDGPFVIWLRNNLMQEICNFEHEGCMEETKRQFNNWLEKDDSKLDNTIDPNYREAIYCYGFVDEDKDVMLSRYKWFEEKMLNAKREIWDYEYHRMYKAHMCQNAVLTRLNEKSNQEELENEYEEMGVGMGIGRTTEEVSLERLKDTLFNRDKLEKFRRTRDNYPRIKLPLIDSIIAQAEHRIEWVEGMLEIIQEVFKN